jgi:hypothetical protein
MGLDAAGKVLEIGDLGVALTHSPKMLLYLLPDRGHVRSVVKPNHRILDKLWSGEELAQFRQGDDEKIEQGKPAGSESASPLGLKNPNHCELPALDGHRIPNSCPEGSGGTAAQKNFTRSLERPASSDRKVHLRHELLHRRVIAQNPEETLATRAFNVGRFRAHSDGIPHPGDGPNGLDIQPDALPEVKAAGADEDGVVAHRALHLGGNSSLQALPNGN